MPPSHLPKLSPRRIAAVDSALKARAAASGRPPSYGGGRGTYLPGSGFGPDGGLSRDYLREAGRIDLNPLVRLILDWYANAYTQVVFRVGRRLKKGGRKGEYEANLSHDLNRIFRRPCPVFSARETGAMFIGGLLIDGNAYGVIVEDNGGRPSEVWWVPNWQVEVIAGDGTDPRRPIRAYRIHDLDGGWREYPPEMILHIRDLPDPRNPLVGYGRLKCFLPYLVAVESGGEYTNEALSKGNVGIVLMPPPDAGGDHYYTEVEEAQMRAHQRRLQVGLARGGSSPVMFLTAYLAHQKIGLSPQEMEASTILDRPESYVLAAGGLSSMVLNLPSAMSGQTFANKAEASRAAWEDSALPMFTLIAEAYQDQVLYRRDPDTGEEEGRFGDAPGLEIWPDTSHVPALTENLQEKADLWIALTDAGYVKREWVAKTHFDIPEEAIPEEEEEEEEDDDDDAGEDWLPGDEAEVDEQDDDEDEPAPSDPDAVKAKGGGGGKRKKGASSASSTPPNVRAAAARLKRGEATGEDQKLLARWRRRNAEKLPDVPAARYEKAVAATVKDLGKRDKAGNIREDAMGNLQDRITALEDGIRGRAYARVDRDPAWGDRLERAAARRGMEWEDFIAQVGRRRAIGRVGRGLAAADPTLARRFATDHKVLDAAGRWDGDFSPEDWGRLLRVLLARTR